MKEIIAIAALIGSLYGGTVFAGKILENVRREALTKAAHGLPHLSPLAHALTTQGDGVSQEKGTRRRK